LVVFSLRPRETAWRRPQKSDREEGERAATITVIKSPLLPLSLPTAVINIEPGLYMQVYRGGLGKYHGCFQVQAGKFSRKARCGKLERRNRPISAARGNI
jgi:hypothetical protein